MCLDCLSFLSYCYKLYKLLASPLVSILGHVYTARLVCESLTIYMYIPLLSNVLHVNLYWLV